MWSIFYKFSGTGSGTKNLVFIFSWNIQRSWGESCWCSNSGSAGSDTEHPQGYDFPAVGGRGQQSNIEYSSSWSTCYSSISQLSIGPWVHWKKTHEAQGTVQPFQHYLFMNRGTFNHKLLRQDMEMAIAIPLWRPHLSCRSSSKCSLLCLSRHWRVPRLRDFHSTFGFIHLIGDPPRATGRSKATHSVLSEDWFLSLVMRLTPYLHCTATLKTKSF